MKSVIFSEDHKNLGSVHNLSILVLQLNHHDKLYSMANQLENLIVKAEATRYPNFLKFPNIPNTWYDENKANEAIQLTTFIIEFIRDNYPKTQSVRLFLLRIGFLNKYIREIFYTTVLFLTLTLYEFFF